MVDTVTLNIYFTYNLVGFLTFVVHSLTVQSNDDVTKRWEKSIGPTAM